MEILITLLENNYVTIPTSHSWERIALFVPWVPHGIELRPFCLKGMTKFEVPRSARRKIPTTIHFCKLV